MLSSGESDAGAALVSTGGTDAGAKIYSNGLDFEKAIEDPNFFDTISTIFTKSCSLSPSQRWLRLTDTRSPLDLGWSCAHDYRVMNAKRGYLCMNEIDFGAPLPHGLQQALASKIADQRTMRKIVLEGHRFSAKEAFDDGFVDALADSPQETLDKALELAGKLKGKAR